MVWQLLVMKPTLPSLPWLLSTMLVHDMRLMPISGWHTASVWLSIRWCSLKNFGLLLTSHFAQNYIIFPFVLSWVDLNGPNLENTSHDHRCFEFILDKLLQFTSQQHISKWAQKLCLVTSENFRDEIGEIFDLIKISVDPSVQYTFGRHHIASSDRALEA